MAAVLDPVAVVRSVFALGIRVAVGVSRAPTGVVAASVALGRTASEVDWPAEPAQLRLALALRDALLGLLVRGHRL
jgi:hypothetical protein